MPDVPEGPPFGHTTSAMAAAVRNADWRNSPLGPIDTWPASLKTAVSLVLDSPGPRILVWGPELITFYNDGYVPMLGALANDGVGRDYRRFRPDMWPIIGPYVESAMAGSPQLVTQLRTVRRTSGDEEVGYFSVCFTPVRDDRGAIAGVMGDIIEITARVQIQTDLEAENKRFRELFTQAPVFMALTATADFRIEYANSAYERMIGGRDIVGMTAAEALPELEEQGFMTLLTRAYESGEPIIGWDMPFQPSVDGPPVERRFLDFIFQPIRDAEGAVAGILCVGSDVTERHLAKERAERLQRELDHASRMSAMGTMATTIAHELNQPLTAAGNYLAASHRMAEALEGRDKASLQVGLARAEQQVRRAGEIIRRARDAVVSEAAPRKMVSLADLVTRSLELVEVTQGCRDVDIRTALSPDATMVSVDRVQAEQVLLNLIRNACQAMDKCPRKALSISSRKLDDGFAEVVLSDTGRGLPEGSTDIFAAFSKSTTGGLGVGLSLSRTLVEAHGGVMWADNNPEGGASFHFTLPLEDGPGAAP
jgi:two-component system sensor kinase FixL